MRITVALSELSLNNACYMPYAVNVVHKSTNKDDRIFLAAFYVYGI